MRSFRAFQITRTVIFLKIAINLLVSLNYPSVIIKVEFLVFIKIEIKLSHFQTRPHFPERFFSTIFAAFLLSS